MEDPVKLAEKYTDAIRRKDELIKEMRRILAALRLAYGEIEDLENQIKDEKEQAL